MSQDKAVNFLYSAPSGSSATHRVTLSLATRHFGAWRTPESLPYVFPRRHTLGVSEMVSGQTRWQLRAGRRQSAPWAQETQPLLTVLKDDPTLIPPTVISFLDLSGLGFNSSLLSPATDFIFGFLSTLLQYSVINDPVTQRQRCLSRDRAREHIPFLHVPSGPTPSFRTTGPPCPRQGIPI